MKVAEIFHSIQGEGKLTGVPSVFVRAAVCNLRCAWCDTPYASWESQGDEISVDQIVEQVSQYPARHVVLTGGEPMIMRDIAPLAQALKQRGLHITVETAGTFFTPLPVDLASISPKLSNSTPWQRDGGRYAMAHEKHRLNLPAIQQLMDAAADFQLKFVVSDPSDLQEIEQILALLRGWSPGDVLLMPEGIDAAALASRGPWVAELCKKTGYRFCPRLHIELFGNKRGV